MKRLTIAIATLTPVILLATTAFAENECFRHSECDVDNLCINTTCTAPVEPLSACASDGTCSEYAEVCDEGYCKRDGVYCENDAGHCIMGNGFSRRCCADGVCSEGKGQPEDPSPTDEELYEQCQESLVGMCGDTAPDIHDECTDEQLTMCESYYEKLNELWQACGEDTEEVFYAKLASCCRHSDNEDFVEKYNCLMALEAAECDKMADCYPEADRNDGEILSGGEQSGDDDDSKTDEASKSTTADNTAAETESSAEDGDADDSDDGCSVVPVGRQTDNAVALFIALAFGLVVVRLRRQN